MLNQDTLIIGQYFPENSLIHRLDPRTKIINSLLVIIIAFIISKPISFFILFSFLVLTASLSRVPWLLFYRGLRLIVIFLIISGLLQVMFYPGKKVLVLEILPVSIMGLRLFAKITAQLFCALLSTLILTLTTSPLMLTYGLEKLLKPLAKVRFPVEELALMITTALRFIPAIYEELDKIMKAQAARGVDMKSKSAFLKGKYLTSIIVPMFMNTFRRAEELAVAIESRGYGLGIKRTEITRSRFKRSDYLFFLLMSIVFCLVLYFDLW